MVALAEEAVDAHFMVEIICSVRGVSADPQASRDSRQGEEPISTKRRTEAESLGLESVSLEGIEHF